MCVGGGGGGVEEEGPLNDGCKENVTQNSSDRVRILAVLD